MALVASEAEMAEKLAVIDAAASRAQELMYRFFIRMNRIEASVLERQAQLRTTQGAIHGIILTIVLIISLSSLAVQRREAAARSARNRAERKAEFLAYYDPLTDLPNRTQFHAFGEDMLIMRRSVALILLDLDNFKEINDRYGHGMGDAVLREVGLRLKREADENRGMAARLGGDEFAMLLPSDNTAFLNRLCEGLLEVVAAPVDYGGKSVVPAVSIGLATASQMMRGRAPDLEMLTRFADFALYASKQAGRGRFTLYDSELDRCFSERRDMLEELPQAIRSGGLSVYLQPKVDMWTSETYGFEALVRWNRRGEIVLPNKFIEIAEEGGHIKAVDLRMLQDATSQVAAWNDRHGSGFSLSINISALHLLDETDTLKLVKAIGDAPLAPELLTLEITETVQLGDWSRVGAAIATLRTTGCRISIDDFGTGYSSLAYLRAIPADELKIDKSLVAEVEASAESQFILDAVIDLARSLDMTVIVEGIERQSQVRLLCDLGCRLGQGFLFGRPQPSEVALAAATRAEADAASHAHSEAEQDLLFFADAGPIDHDGRPDRGRRLSRIP
jgi:diguanylate cyclase (GGDEF)-like protein